MAGINVGAVMDALALALTNASITKHVYAWPSESVVVPAAIVGYPDPIDFDMTFGRGSDSATFPIWLVVGKVSERTARNILSAYITGATGIKNTLDGNLSGSVQSCRVVDCKIESVAIGGVPYLAARFDCEVFS